jgi:hypothetical protein
MLPVTGHWHLRAGRRRFLDARRREEPDDERVRALSAEKAREEWDRLEFAALGLRRPALHEFFADSRTCLACTDRAGGVAAVCWLAEDGDVGPAVGVDPEATATVVVAVLRRAAEGERLDPIGVFCTTANRCLLERLQRLGFWVHWPSWIMSSAPMPVLDRYVPTRPPYLL